MHRLTVLAASLVAVSTAALAAPATNTSAAGASTPAGPAMAGPSQLEIGGRTLRFDAAPSEVASFVLPFEAGNALLLQDARQRLRQPDLGPLTGGNGTLLHLVLVTAADPKLAFERARTVRAELVRLGVAEPRALAAAAREDGAASSAPASPERIEEATVRIVRLTRASCQGCGPTTLGSFALDSGAVRLARLTLGDPAGRAAALPQARSADRREPPQNLSFQDRPALATPAAPAADSAAAAAGPRPPAQPRPHPGVAGDPEPPAVQKGRIHPAAVAPAQRQARLTREVIRLADARALGGLPGPGCRARLRPIDDYGPHPRIWTCAVR